MERGKGFKPLLQADETCVLTCKDTFFKKRLHYPRGTYNNIVDITISEKNNNIANFRVYKILIIKSKYSYSGYF